MNPLRSTKRLGSRSDRDLAARGHEALDKGPWVANLSISRGTGRALSVGCGVRLRRERFATQAEFAAALTKHGLKVTVATVSEWERGYRMASLSDLPLIAATLEVPVQSLIPSKAFLQKFCDNQK